MKKLMLIIMVLILSTLNVFGQISVDEIEGRLVFEHSLIEKCSCQEAFATSEFNTAEEAKKAGKIVVIDNEANLAAMQKFCQNIASFDATVKTAEKAIEQEKFDEAKRLVEELRFLSTKRDEIYFFWYYSNIE